MLLLAFNYCVTDRTQRLNAAKCRTWMAKTVQKKEILPWVDILGSNFEAKEHDTNANVIRRLKSSGAARPGDFVLFFQWVLTCDHPAAAIIKDRLRANHSELPAYEAAIAASIACRADFPFPDCAKEALSWASRILRQRGATRRGGGETVAGAEHR